MNTLLHKDIQHFWHPPSCSSGWMRKHAFMSIFVIGHQRIILTGVLPIRWDLSFIISDPNNTWIFKYVSHKAADWSIITHWPILEVVVKESKRELLNNSNLRNLIEVFMIGLKFHDTILLFSEAPLSLLTVPRCRSGCFLQPGRFSLRCCSERRAVVRRSTGGEDTATWHRF